MAVSRYSRSKMSKSDEARGFRVLDDRAAAPGDMGGANVNNPTPPADFSPMGVMGAHQSSIPAGFFSLAGAMPGPNPMGIFGQLVGKDLAAKSNEMSRNMNENEFAAVQAAINSPNPNARISETSLASQNNPNSSLRDFFNNPFAQPKSPKTGHVDQEDPNNPNSAPAATTGGVAAGIGAGTGIGASAVGNEGIGGGNMGNEGGGGNGPSGGVTGTSPGVNGDPNGIDGQGLGEAGAPGTGQGSSSSSGTGTGVGTDAGTGPSGPGGTGGVGDAGVGVAHQGGVVPGAPGSEQPIVAQGGEYVVPQGGFANMLRNADPRYIPMMQKSPIANYIDPDMAAKGQLMQLIQAMAGPNQQGMPQPEGEQNPQDNSPGGGNTGTGGNNTASSSDKAMYRLKSMTMNFHDNEDPKYSKPRK